MKTTDYINSDDETHKVTLHPKRIYEDGYVYVHRNRKGKVFWSITVTHKFDVDTIKYYQSKVSTKLEGKYYYTLACYDKNNNYSGADVTFDGAFVKESSD